MDGDTIFSITTSQDIKEQVLDNVDILALGSTASDCVARACNRAIYEAEPVGNSKPGWKNFFQSKWLFIIFYGSKPPLSFSNVNKKLKQMEYLLSRHILIL